MRRLLTCVLLLGGMLLAGGASAADAKLRVLLTVGGHGFEEEAFYAVFKAMPDVTFQVAQMPQDAGRLKPGLEKDFDVIVMYDMVAGITPEQQKAFVELLRRGIGLVSLHHNLGAHGAWPEFARIIGGKFFLKETEFQGKKFKPLQWQHDQDLTIQVADPDHPITRGLKDFQIHDETYRGYWTDPKARVLLKTNHPKNNPEIAWVKQYGNSRVFYLMLGHDSKAYANPSFREVIHRAIHWTARK